MTLNEFKTKYLGGQVEYHSFGGEGTYNQCVDLVNQYIVEVLHLTPIIGTHAKDFPNNYDKNQFEWIANTPTGVPKVGDVVVWNGRVGGGAGHVGIFLNGNSNTFTSLDQNWSQKERVTLENHTYSNVSGWLHPKGNMATVQVDASKFEELVNKSTKYDAFVSAGFPTIEVVKQIIDDYKRDNSALKQDRDIANATVEERRKEWNELIAFLASELGTRQDVQEIKDVVEHYDKVVADADKTKDDYSRDKLAWASAEAEFNAEIARLQALLGQENVLEKSSTRELIKEVLRRLIRITDLI